MAEEETTQNEAPVKKSKKINKLSIAELNQKIEELEKTNQNNSKYFKHLIIQRQELLSKSDA